MHTHPKAIFMVIVLLVATPSAPRAQISPSGSASYDLSVLSSQDWNALGQSLLSQSVRGSMALVFPDRAPITDPRAVEQWVVSGKPLRGVAFPGVTGDSAAAWSMAKQLAQVNHQQDARAQPVLAVNSGWTDWWAGFGHLAEWSTLRAAVDQGKPYTSDPVSNRVGRMLRSRMDRQAQQGLRPETVALAGHSAGGYYSANVAWLLGSKHAGNLRVYNVGLSAKLPRGVKAVQVVGTDDHLAQVNSHSAALASPSTRLEEGLSHHGGADWDLGDSFNARRWRFQPLDKAFKAEDNSLRAHGRQGLGPVPSRDTLLTLASRLKRRAKAAKGVAARHRASSGIKKILFAKLDHDASMLELNAKRTTALADWMRAKQKSDPGGILRAKQELRSLRQQKRQVMAKLHRARRLPRNIVSDSMQFMSMLTSETAVSFAPTRLWQKTIQTSAASTQWALRLGRLWLSNPLVNPWSALSDSSGRRAKNRR